MLKKLPFFNVFGHLHNYNLCNAFQTRAVKSVYSAAEKYLLGRTNVTFASVTGKCEVLELYYAKQKTFCFLKKNVRCIQIWPFSQPNNKQT